jgi:aryl-alcohol dehydrogenase-like predicted oxidoreductase
VAWIIAQPGVTAALVGARNAEQAHANAGAGRLVLTPGEIQTIRDTFEPLHLDEPFDPATAKR